MSSTTIGFILVVSAAILNGSFIVPFKLKFVRDLNLDPYVFQLYASIGIFFSSMICAAFVPFNSSFVEGGGNELKFSIFGMLSGIVIMSSITCSFLATERVGVAIAQGTFCGSAILTSYFWSVFAFNETPHNIALSAFGVIFLCLGVLGIAFSNDITKIIFKIPERVQIFDKNDWSTSLNDSGLEDGGRLIDSPYDIVNTSSSRDNTLHIEEQSARRNFSIGLLFAIITGVLGGSALVPLHYVDSSESGFVFLPAFGVGSVIASPILFLLKYFLTTSSSSSISPRRLPAFHIRETLFVGCASGVIWNINNICAIGAIPRLGYGVAFPITQCAIFVGGTWGIVLFREIVGHAVVTFYGAAVVLLIGAIMLSLGA